MRYAGIRQHEVDRYAVAQPGKAIECKHIQKPVLPGQNDRQMRPGMERELDVAHGRVRQQMSLCHEQDDALTLSAGRHKGAEALFERGILEAGIGGHLTQYRNQIEWRAYLEHRGPQKPGMPGCGSKQGIGIGKPSQQHRVAVCQRLHKPVRQSCGEVGGKAVVEGKTVHSARHSAMPVKSATSLQP